MVTVPDILGAVSEKRGWARVGRTNLHPSAFVAVGGTSRSLEGIRGDRKKAKELCGVDRMLRKEASGNLRRDWEGMRHDTDGAEKKRDGKERRGKELSAAMAASLWRPPRSSLLAAASRGQTLNVFINILQYIHTAKYV